MSDHSVFQFLPAGTDLSDALIGTHNGPLVGLSVLLAVLSSYAALEVAGRLSRVPHAKNKRAWLLSCAVVLGIGIWAMHFTGMMAFEIEESVTYHFAFTALSVLPAIGASYCALWFISRPKIRIAETVIGGVVLGGGIGAMHLVGMMGMQTSAIMYYRPEILAAAVVGAVLLAMLSISVRFVLEKVFENKDGVWASLIGATIMGASIATMHYAAMLSTVFMPGHGGGGVMMTSYIEILSMVTGAASVLIGLAVVLASEFEPKTDLSS